jgi:hypothetical protein
MTKDVIIKSAYKKKARKDKTRIRNAFQKKFCLDVRSFDYKMNGIRSKFSDEELDFMFTELKLGESNGVQEES